MQNLEAEYFRRLARVGAVVLVVAVLLGFAYNAQRRAEPPPAAAKVDEGVPVILLENARIADEEPEVVTVPEELPSLKSTNFSGSFFPRSTIEDLPRLDSGEAKPNVMQVPSLSVEPLLMSGSPLFETPDRHISSSKSSVVEVTPPPKRPGQK